MYTAHCGCMAGLGEACSHVAALLFIIEAGVKLGLTRESSISRACEWNNAFCEKIDPVPMVERFELTERNRKNIIPSCEYTPKAPKFVISLPKWRFFLNDQKTG